MKRFHLGFHSIALAALVAGCGSSPDGEKGVLPEKGVLAQDPPTEQLVALTFDIAGNRLLKAYPHALYQSRDGGREWEAIPLPRSVQRGRIVAVAVPAKAAGTLYVAGPGFGIMRTQDEGATWVTLNRGLLALDIEALAAHAQIASTVFISIAGRGVYRSEDGGATWTGMDRGPGDAVRQLVHSDLGGSMNTGWLYAATPSGVHRAMDCFCGWRQAGGGPAASALHSVVFDPDEPQQLYASGPTGVLLSRDGGESWEMLSAGGPEKIALAFDPSTDALYAATREGIILRGHDHGARWERVGG